jgi:hypothetical protein
MIDVMCKVLIILIAAMCGYFLAQEQDVVRETFEFAALLLIFWKVNGQY